MASEARARGGLEWEALSQPQQANVLGELAQKRRARYRREYPELLGVGHGFKRVKGQRLLERCFAFLVQQKTKQVPQLPSHLSATVMHRGEKRRVKVPTDVEELGLGRTHNGVNAAAGVYVASKNYPQFNATGSICCLVRVAGRQELFALSCNHVLTLSSVLSNGQVAEDALVAEHASHLPFGQLATYFPLEAGKPNQIDAALAFVDPSTQWDYDGAAPREVEMGLVEPQSCGVFTPRGLEPATYVKIFYDLALPYPTESPIRIVAAYQFEASTYPGDSGSAVMDNSDTLYAMHFWGDASQNFSLAIPAGYLFSPGTFGNIRLSLA